MPFPPELQARIDEARSKGGDSSATDEVSVLKAKLASREGKGGFKQNCEDIRARLAELGAL